jgi:hypothetical protein
MGWDPSHPLGKDVTDPFRKDGPVTGHPHIDPTKGKRDADNAAKSELEKQKAITDALGKNELDLYYKGMGMTQLPGGGWVKTGEGPDKYDPDKAMLSKGQIAFLDKSQHNQQTRVKAIMANLGISDSTMATAMLNNLDQDRAIAEGSMLDQNKQFIMKQKIEAFQEAHIHYQNAMQALGMSNELMQQAYQIDQNYSNMVMQEWTALIGAASTIAGASIGGPAGAAAGGASSKSLTQNPIGSGSTSLPSYNTGMPNTLPTYPGIDF